MSSLMINGLGWTSIFKDKCGRFLSVLVCDCFAWRGEEEIVG